MNGNIVKLFVTLAVVAMCVSASWNETVESGSGMPCDYSCSMKSASNWKMSQNGIDLLTAFEGFSSSCYKDSVGVWTIGYGHACQDSSDDLPQYGVTCNGSGCSGTLTESQAENVLADDISDFESCVKSAVKISVTNNQYDAMVSLAFNIGCSAFKSSTLVSEINSGKLTDKEAQYQFTRWNSGCIEGLERRRFTESQLFTSCSSKFACSHTSCSISYNYPKCSSNCAYCSSCGGCNGNTYSMDTCEGGGGNDDNGGGSDDNSSCDTAGCQSCVKYGGGKACADDACKGCSDACLTCIENGGGTACYDRCG